MQLLKDYYQCLSRSMTPHSSSLHSLVTRFNTQQGQSLTSDYFLYSVFLPVQGFLFPGSCSHLMSLTWRAVTTDGTDVFSERQSCAWGLGWHLHHAVEAQRGLNVLRAADRVHRRVQLEHQHTQTHTPTGHNADPWTQNWQYNTLHRTSPELEPDDIKSWVTATFAKKTGLYQHKHGHGEFWCRKRKRISCLLIHVIASPVSLFPPAHLCLRSKSGRAKSWTTQPQKLFYSCSQQALFAPKC